MPSSEVISFAKATSRLLGWIYTLSWSLSFYPQPLLNIRRRSTIGTNPSFPIANVLGFLAYSISTLCLYYSPLIRGQYAARNPTSPDPTVRGNDVAFAVHALFITLILSSMYWKPLWGFQQEVRKGGKWRISKGIVGILLGCVLGIALTAILVLLRGGDGGKDPSRWAWLDVVYVAGYVKLIITVIKYIPQVSTNYKRKSTEGWSIEQIQMDLLGGIFSITQLLIDSSLQKDWSGLIGNPVKFGLGNISIAFDLVFIAQHYFLYRHPASEKEAISNGEGIGLLASQDLEAAK